MMRYLRARMGERTTAIGSVLSFGLILLSFLVPPDRGDIADTMRGIAVPLFVALFLWEDRK